MILGPEHSIGYWISQELPFQRHYRPNAALGYPFPRLLDTGAVLQIVNDTDLCASHLSRLQYLIQVSRG
jgi:hypothetical protein